MLDFLDNEINIGDKVIFAIPFGRRKELDYGIVESFTKNKNSCYCKSFKYDKTILRYSNQLVKMS